MLELSLQEYEHVRGASRQFLGAPGDEGTGFRGGASSGSGPGLALIAQTADRFAIRERTPRGIEMWMRFRPASAATSRRVIAG